MKANMILHLKKTIVNQSKDKVEIQKINSMNFFLYISDYFSYGIKSFNYNYNKNFNI